MLKDTPVKLMENKHINLLGGLGGIMLSTAQTREVLNYIKAVNDSAYVQLRKNNLNSIILGNLSLPPYIVGTSDFFVATEDATAIQ